MRIKGVTRDRVQSIRAGRVWNCARATGSGDEHPRVVIYIWCGQIEGMLWCLLWSKPRRSNSHVGQVLRMMGCDGSLSRFVGRSSPRIQFHEYLARSDLMQEDTFFFEQVSFIAIYHLDTNHHGVSYVHKIERMRYGDPESHLVLMSDVVDGDEVYLGQH